MNCTTALGTISYSKSETSYILCHSLLGSSFHATPWSHFLPVFSSIAVSYTANLIFFKHVNLLQTNRGMLFLLCQTISSISSSLCGSAHLQRPLSMIFESMTSYNMLPLSLLMQSHCGNASVVTHNLLCWRKETKMKTFEIWDMNPDIATAFTPMVSFIERTYTH